MLKKLVLLLALLLVVLIAQATAESIAITAENFPDEAFRNYLSSSKDFDHDGMLTNDGIWPEELPISSLSISSKGIESLQGIELFPELVSLSCSSNKLTGTLDLRGNPKLETVYCYNNQIDAILVSSCTNLKRLDVENTALLGLDVRRNLRLERLDCSGSQLGLLLLENKPHLYYLDCERCVNLDYIDISGCQLLLADNYPGTYLEVYAQVNREDLREKKPEKVWMEEELLKVDDGQVVFTTVGIEPLDANHTLTWEASNPDVVSVNKYGIITALKPGVTTVTATTVNGLTATCVIDVAARVPFDEEHFPDKSFRSCIGNVYLVDIEDEKCVSREYRESVDHFEFYSSIASLKGLEYFPNLKSLFFDSFNVTELELRDLPKLQSVRCQRSTLGDLRVINCPALETLDCEGSEVRSTQFENLASLQMLDLSFGGSLGAVELHIASLKELYLGRSDVTSLDLSGCTGLEKLNCYRNSIQTLDLSTCPKLIGVDCSDNNLNALDLTHNPDLLIARCSSNDISELDISKCPGLLDLFYNHTLTLKYGYPSFEREEGDIVYALSFDNTCRLYTDSGYFQEPVEASLSPNPLSLSVGESRTLNVTMSPADATPRFTRWFSEDQQVATVQDGVVRAIAPGTTKINLSLDGQYYTCEVTVTGQEIPFDPANAELKLPAGTLTVEAEAFRGITARSVVIPADCTSVGHNAFADCPNLEIVYFADSGTRYESDIIDNSPKARIIVAK